MKKITIDTVFNNSEILIGENWTNFRNYIPGNDVVVITDDNLMGLYGNDFKDLPLISIHPGEKSKQLEVINDLSGKLLKMGVDRNGFLVGIGGGVVCDITGFLASVYMRGLKFGFVSSSLLSQVDASVGGKNGVNVGSVKNILGSFRQPEFVICDPEMLKTLPDDEFLSGLAELIKHGFICDADLVGDIERSREAILKRDSLILTSLIGRSVEIKAAVVREDETERGLRMILNFGHTFGHAIEAQTGLKHGFAVASGMMLSADISVRFGTLTPGERDHLFSLLTDFGLLTDYNITNNQVREFISQDKKKSGDEVNFVMLEKTGKAIVKKIKLSDLMEMYGKLSKGK